MKKDVIVLGSGMSILELSQQEINYINSCEVIIAVNKFMAFYQKSKIVPTHIYYVDAYQRSVQIFLQHIFNICRKNKLKGLTFILNKNISRYSTSNVYLYLYLKYLNLKNVYRKIRYGSINSFLLPKNCYCDFITHQDWLKYDNTWATSLNEPLFHYRGSLSTVLNYISIKYPNRSIRLVGVDFNSPQYFFQQELEELELDWQDWTTPIVKEKGMHFSAVNYQGTTIFDKFGFILEQLSASGNSVYSCNSKSLLVEKGLVQYASLDDKI
jgi:hypothetical protein